MTTINPFKTEITLTAYDAGIPDSVNKEITEDLWPDYCKGNGDSVHFGIDHYGSEKYPNLVKLMQGFGINNCIICYSW